MTNASRTNKNILLCIEEKVIKHDVTLKNLQSQFDNHLRYHETKDRDQTRHFRAVIIVALGAVLTTAGTIVAGLVLLGIRS